METGSTLSWSWELYNLEEDRTKLIDYADRYSDLVQKLDRAYDQWARRCGVLKWDELRTRHRFIQKPS